MKSLKSEIQSPKSKIILIGFMASGKTTVAKALSENLDYNFVDLDQFIESREHRMIASMIDAEGEAHFRKIEAEALRDILEKGSLKIIALGGGTWTIEENRKLISNYDCLTVWLDTSFEVCWERITREGNTRPLARDKEKAKKLFEDRCKVYSLANIRIPTNKETNIETVLALIGKYFVI